MDIDQFDYAPLVDVVDFRRAYIERSKSIVTGSTAVKGWEQMDEHERLQSEYFQEQMKMKCMVVDGKMTVKKYREWKGKLEKGVLVTTEDEEGDLVPMNDSEGESGSDYEAEYDEFERQMNAESLLDGGFSDSEDEGDGENVVAAAANAVGGSGSEEEEEERLNTPKRRRR